ncbi:MAG: hypothetical protein HKN94_10960 [Acidimicrobiales bacterium]|nr:hypothetical protein [Acidimicrobiia bacterium]NNC80658.1 hypothetical protein [Acidimicrobiales bacterium]
MTERRDVRVSAQFFEDLDRQLDTERGHNGEPSAIDFQSIELIEIVEWFATDFDSLPPVFDGRSDYRVLIKNGILVRAMRVVGVLASDGAIELVGLDLDLRMGWD